MRANGGFRGGRKKQGGWAWIPAVIAAVGGAYAVRQQSKAQKQAIAYQEKVRKETEEAEQKAIAAEESKIKAAQEENASATNRAARELQNAIAAQTMGGQKQSPVSILSSPVVLVGIVSIGALFLLKK